MPSLCAFCLHAWNERRPRRSATRGATMKFPGYRRDTAGVKSSRRRHLATSRRRVTRFPLMDSLEDRTVLSTIVWAGGNGDWHTATNWIGGVRPGANDTAQINDPNVTITHNTGDSDSVGDVQF